uniref:EGF-like domain-containing protein n=1 Tax=Setaria viridis TaxID=4556 RepID=A0A4V6D6G9_SETVI|nr:hypothetical protein SEVIR_8G159801v2 [Setaria viridis]
MVPERWHITYGLGTEAPLWTSVLDWAINVSRDGACVSSSSSRVSVRDDQWYLCNCSKGYQGNPYVKDGCKNINERKLPKLYPCPCKFGRRGEDCKPILYFPRLLLQY